MQQRPDVATVHLPTTPRCTSCAGCTRCHTPAHTGTHTHTTHTHSALDLCCGCRSMDVRVGGGIQSPMHSERSCCDTGQKQGKNDHALRSSHMSQGVAVCHSGGVRQVGMSVTHTYIHRHHHSETRRRVDFESGRTRGRLPARYLTHPVIQSNG